MQLTISAGDGWFGPDDRQCLEPWGFRFGQANEYGNSPIDHAPVALTLTTLADWERLLRDLQYCAIVVGTIDPYGDHVFTLVLEEQC